MDIARLERYISEQQADVMSRGAPRSLADLYSPPPSDAGTSASAADPVSAGVASELKSLVNKWSDVSDRIGKMRKVLSSWTEIKNNFEERILVIMREQDLDGLNTSDSMIQFVEKKRKKRKTKTQIRTELLTLVADDSLRESIERLVLDSEADASDIKTSLRRLQLA